MNALFIVMIIVAVLWIIYELVDRWLTPTDFTPWWSDDETIR